MRKIAGVVGLCTLLAGCSTEESSTVATSSQPIQVAKSATLADLRARFVRRFTSPDGEPASEPVFGVGPATLTKGGGRISAALTGRMNATTSIADDMASVDVVARGARARFSLDGMVAGTPELAEGFTILPKALNGTQTVLLRPNADGVEDFVVFETAPAQSRVTYATNLAGVAGLRLFGNELEFLNASGTPVLRVRPPELVDRDGKTIAATLGVEDCAFDASPKGPWGRAVTPPGKSACSVVVSWRNEDVTYPAVLDPSWSATGSLSNARVNHSATLLANGSLLVVGGKNSGSNQGAELYDPLTGTWASTGSPSTTRYQHVAARLANGKVLIAAGATADTSPLSSAELYDPAAGTWSSTGSLTTARRFLTAEALQNGKVLVIGGYDGTSNWYSSCELYDPTAGTWSSTGAMGSARGGAASGVLPSGKVLVTGGNSATAYLATAELYDPSAGTWSSAGTFSTARRQHAQVITQWGDHVVIGGGYTSSTALTATTAVYDVSANSWAEGPTLSVARGKLAGLQLPGTGAVFAGGQTGTSTYAVTAEGFTQSPNTISSLSALSSSRSNYTLSRLSPEPKMIAVGGYNGSYLATVEVFDTNDSEHEMGSSPVMVDWTVSPTMKGSYASSTTLSARVSNFTSTTQTVHIYALASGLDQRVAQRDMGTVSVAGSADRYHPGTSDITIALSDLPVQSVGLQSQVELQAVYHDGQSDQVVVPSSNIYYTFSSDYSAATLYAYDGAEFTITDTGSLSAVMAGISSSAAVLTASGRYWTGSSWTSVSVTSPPTGTETVMQSYMAVGPRLARIRDAAWYDNLTVDQPDDNVSDGPDTYKLCTSWRAEFIDPQPSGSVVDPKANNHLIPASYSEYIVEQFNGTAHDSWVAHGFLDAAGCTKRLALLPTTRTYKLWQFSTLDGGSSKPFFDVQFGGWNPTTNGYSMGGGSGGTGNATKWDVYYPYGTLEVTGVGIATTTSTKTVTVTTSGYDVATNVAGQAGRLLVADGMGWERFGSSRTAPMFLYANIMGSKAGPFPDCKLLPLCNPMSTDTGFFVKGSGVGTGVFLGPSYFTPHNARYKSIIGHEMGHDLQWHKMGMSNFLFGDHPSTAAACSVDHVLDKTSNSHCLQSLQDNGFALNEGFAHFISARAVQTQSPSTCKYVYYKEFREDDAGADGNYVVSPPVTKTCVGGVKWAVNHCASAGNTVEWDWLNFFWGVNTDASHAISIDEIGAMYRKACSNANCTNQFLSYDALTTTPVLGELSDALKRSLFLDSGNTYGTND